MHRQNVNRSFRKKGTVPDQPPVGARRNGPRPTFRRCPGFAQMGTVPFFLRNRVGSDGRGSRPRCQVV